MAINNPQANFNFRLEIDGVSMDMVQVVTPPKPEHAVHLQGSPGTKPDKKTPGKKMIGQLVVEMVVPDNDSDNVLWNKFQSVQTLNREVYAGVGYLVETNEAGAQIARWYLGDAWISAIETSQYSTRGDDSDNLIRTVTWEVEEYTKIA